MINFDELYDWNLVTNCNGGSYGCFRCKYRNREEPILNNEVMLAPLEATTDVLVCNHSDLFNGRIPGPFIDRVMSVIAYCNEKQFYLSTKYPRRMQQYLNGLAENREYLSRAMLQISGSEEKAAEVLTHIQNWPLANLHIGVSCESHCWAMNRLPQLLATTSAHHFLLAEPFNHGINLALAAGTPTTPSLEFVIIGAEYGEGAHPIEGELETMAQDLESQCTEAGIPHWRRELS